jgi:hypothetical protein
LLDSPRIVNQGVGALLANLITETGRYAEAALASPDELLAVASVIVAAGFVLAGSFVKTMIPLRM